MAPTLYDEKPKPGDLIEIFRGSYQHWAVYVGDGFVVHLAPPSEVPGAGNSSMMSVLYDKAVVKKEELWDVVGTNKWEINNSLDNNYIPRPAYVIVHDACNMVGLELPYCIIRGNCEHFVNELRYGKAESRQVQKAGEVVLAAGAAAVVGFGLIALGRAVFGGSKNENDNIQ
ncbi:phospholipase A and acyltransferase 3-like [Girardinichthys multiradiatus]|uniref:phospholipase A and acyltransferase 3-like n=1 Tax=Girardinichthys multiradiatus TaxID=208333 RepID=UPI001FAD171C|nr:phospholipase A and acyltransferase 3-like [Girardinichthys multiradiatus]XP_047208839.1 phospholipase A and acyltransferase 3-like [Girardinichthys multiradiatus]